MALAADLGSDTPSRRRLRIRAEGIVQGVGFRPYLYRLARSLGLAGHARNDPHGVRIEVEGTEAAVAEFLVRLPAEAPPLASIERIRTEELVPLEESGFAIAASEPGEDPAAGSAEPSALIPPDITTCDACLRELVDPADRRYRYPFTNCTHCGPRYTIVRGLPFDRPLTTMSGFTMCARCRVEYMDPADRRFHAQPNACPECGPRLRVVAGSGIDPRQEAGVAMALPGDMPDAIHSAATALRAGAIVALKGLGGFHLACLARDGTAVRRLRERKRRPAKPFALMVPDLAVARQLVELDVAEEELLCSRERPIVLVRRRDAGYAAAGVDHRISAVADEVAPGQRELGVMLPYTPLHHLLLTEVGEALVMTSGNRSDEPIAFRNDDALTRLADIADLFLLHDRPIQLPVDDSVARVVTIAGERRVQLIRRSRGYVPRPLTLPLAATRPVLACGAELKNTFCLARGERAWLSQHIGDLEDYETERSFNDGVAHLERLCGVRPTLLAHDLHPEFRSTKYALGRTAGGHTETEMVAAHGPAEVERSSPLDDIVPATLPVQHHHAHLAACLAEYGDRGPALGLIFDGTGYGTDGAIWGGEILLGDLVRYERVAHLLPVPMPGGDAAIREPWRMACAWLMAAMGLTPTTTPPIPATLAGRVEPRRWAVVARLAATGLAAPLTTSMGRLFDAVGALCGLCTHASYEGEAAIGLEGVVDPAEMGYYELPAALPASPAPPTPRQPGPPIRENAPAESNAPLVLDPRPLIRAIIAELAAGIPVETIAARFHNTLVRATVTACTFLAERHGVRTVALSGGVFQNRVLLERSTAELARAGLRVLVPSRVPPNDGGISFGQAAIAAARDALEPTIPGGGYHQTAGEDDARGA